MTRKQDPDTFELFTAVQPLLPLGAAPAPARKVQADAEKLPHPWQEFLQRLTDVLAALEDGHWLGLENRSTGHFVGISAHGAAGFKADTDAGRRTQRSAREHEADAAKLLDLGWERLPLDQATPSGVARDGEHFREWPAPAPAEEIALLAVRTLRQVWGAAYPRDLLYVGTDTRSHDILLPTLRLDRRPRNPALADTGHLLRPASQRELAAAVVEALKELTKLTDLTADEEGWIGLTKGLVPIFVRIGKQSPTVDITAYVASGAAASPELLAAINDENGRWRGVTFYAHEGRIIARGSVVWKVFVPELFTEALGDLAEAALTVRKKLRETFADTLFFDEERPSGVNPGADSVN